VSVADFTPTQRRILDVLADRMPHRREELHACLPDDLGALANLRFHLSQLRKVLRPHGQDIICQLYRNRLHYRQICFRQHCTCPRQT
jgi:DNA-binding winged helix-turn-helix (wHTH) protein